MNKNLDLLLKWTNLKFKKKKRDLFKKWIFKVDLL